MPARDDPEDLRHAMEDMDTDGPQLEATMVPLLKSDQIRFILTLLAEETVVEPSPGFPYRVSKKGFGYSADPQRSALQAHFSIQLEMATRAEQK